jgi:hypothetical protein
MWNYSNKLSNDRKSKTTVDVISLHLFFYNKINLLEYTMAMADIQTIYNCMCQTINVICNNPNNNLICLK